MQKSIADLFQSFSVAFHNDFNSSSTEYSFLLWIQLYVCHYNYKPKFGVIFLVWVWSFEYNWNYDSLWLQKSSQIQYILLKSESLSFQIRLLETAWNYN